VSLGDHLPEDGLTQTRVQHALAAVVAGGFVMAFLYVSYPQIDLWVSKQFFVQPTIFALTHSDDRLQFIGYIREAGFLITRITMIGLLVFLVLACVLRYSPLRHYRKRLVYVFLCFVLAPGFIVSVVLKENWGRARPSHLVEFGGKMQYTPPMVRADQCKGNCSFPSGEVAFSFCFLAFAMVARRRKFWIKVALAYGSFYAFLRVSEGGHFLSDVSFSALISVITCLMLYRFMFERAYAYDAIAGWTEKRTAPAFAALSGIRNRLSAKRSSLEVDWPDTTIPAPTAKKPGRKKARAAKKPANDAGAASTTPPLARIGAETGVVQLHPVQKN
jgi:lipid A 4'-phosphatase